MPDGVQTGQEPYQHWRAVVITSLLCGIPAISPALEWLRTFIPLAPFYYSTTLGRKAGLHVSLFAFIIAGIFSLLANNIGNAFYPVTSLPVGLILAWGMEKRKSVGWAGLWATVFILFGWVVGGLLYLQTTGDNPYSEGLKAMDQAFASMAEMYKSSGDFPPDVVAELEQGLVTARQKLPLIFPALLIMSAMVIAWLNMILGNYLIGRHAPEKTVWSPYRYWRLPENLVWLVILAGIFFILPITSLKTIGLNSIVILGIVYFFQGLAVLFAMLERWDAPRPIRFFILFLIFIQTYSIVLLAVLGMIDVWKDLGKIYKNEEPQP